MRSFVRLVVYSFATSVVAVAGALVAGFVVTLVVSDDSPIVSIAQLACAVAISVVGGIMSTVGGPAQ